MSWLVGPPDGGREAAEVALGHQAPDLLIRGGRLVNVYSGEVLDGWEVALAVGEIAWVGAGPWPGLEAAEVIEADGAYLVPGYVDAHGHADFLTNPLALAEALLPLGTTCMLTDTHDVITSLGTPGLDLMLDVVADLPFRYLFTVPVHVPPYPAFEGPDVLSQEEILRYAAHPRVLSVSEVTAWIRLIDGERELSARVRAAREAGLRVEGHTAGCSLEKMAALVDLGVTSCHESITPEEVLARLRMGLATILRHGSIRSDLDVLTEPVIQDPMLDTSRMLLSPDWMSPHDVLERGYLDHLVAEAIALGVPPVKAVQMATINPATYLRMDHRLGGIAPGRVADILLVEDLATARPHLVLAGGRVVARDGALLESLPSFPALPVDAWLPSRVPAQPLAREAFRLSPVLEPRDDGARPSVHMSSKTITRLVAVEVPVADGFLAARSGRCVEGHCAGEEVDLLALAMWSGLMGRWHVVPLSGFGAPVGGLVSTLAHDIHMPVVLGADPDDMVRAVDRMLEIGGGYVLIDRGQVQREVALAAGGTIHTGGLADLAAQLRDFNEELRERGCPFDDPLFALGFLGFTGLPYARITPRGLLDSRRGAIVTG